MKLFNRIAGGLVVAAVVLLFDGAGSAQAQWDVTRLTNDAYRDEHPKVSSGNVTWRKKVSYPYEVFAIWFHDGTTSTQVAPAYYYTLPEISGSNVVWTTYYPSGSPTSDCSCPYCNCHDEDDVLFMSSGGGAATPITCRDGTDNDGDGNLCNDTRAWHPVVSGSNVAWAEGWALNPKHIWLYDGLSETCLLGEGYEAGNLQISGSNVVCQGRAWPYGGDWEIFLGSSPLTNNTVDDTDPQISGSRVVWLRAGNVWLWNGSAEVQLALSGNCQNPRISGSYAVWSESGYIKLYNIDTAGTVQLGIYGSGEPSISGPIVAWRHGNPGEIYVYDIRDGTQTRLTNNTYQDSYPEVSGGTVVWQGQAANPDDDSGWEIFKAVTRGDLDSDADVDLEDFVYFRGCFNGPNRLPAQSNCDRADFDDDNDVDLEDFAVFRNCFNGPNRSPACH